jgi:hypothetical protein
MPTGGESTIALEHLDSHIKAIIKLKLRAFVHLNPCFDSIHSIDTSSSQTSTISSSPLSLQAVPRRQAAQDFPPIPPEEPSPANTPLRAIEHISARLPYSFEQNAQSPDCPNRLATARLRRRARV